MSFLQHSQWFSYWKDCWNITYYGKTFVTLRFVSLDIWESFQVQAKTSNLPKILLIVSAWVLVPPSKPQPSNFFWPPRHWKTEQAPPPPRQTKSPDNSNVLHMFNNNTFTEQPTNMSHSKLHFSSDLRKPKCPETKLFVVWLKQAKINIWNWVLRAFSCLANGTNEIF